jgi:hypothetical protein
MKRAAVLLSVLVAGCVSNEVAVPSATPPADVGTATEPAPSAAEPPAATAAAPIESPAAPAADEPAKAPATNRACIFENSKPWPRPRPGTLATMGYPPTESEKPLHEKTCKGEGTPFGDGAAMTMPREVGKDVAWFGVVRGISVDEKRAETRLLLENKYFDGLTDTHILCVSFAGGGDFVAALPGTEHDVRPLALLRVYGRVASVKDDVPRVEASYVRQFDQGTYCFMMVDGEPGGNQEWRKLCRIADDRIYSPFPGPSYYVERLGRREDFAQGKVTVPGD